MPNQSLGMKLSFKNATKIANHLEHIVGETIKINDNEFKAWCIVVIPFYKGLPPTADWALSDRESNIVHFWDQNESRYAVLVLFNEGDWLEEGVRVSTDCFDLKDVGINVDFDEIIRQD